MEPPSALPAHSHKPKRTRFDNSDEKWEMQREAIRQLYISQNHPLKKVMAIMRDTYGFQAR
jgi:Clr5 domain